MGIIRLTLITAALIWLAMYYYGRDDGLPDSRLGRAPTPAEVSAPTPDTPPAVAPIAEAEPEPAPVTPAPAPVAEAPTPAPTPAPVAEPASPQEPVAEPEPVVEATPVPAPVPDSAPVAAPEPDPEPVPVADAILYVTGEVVNVRSGPSTAFEAITSLPRGTAVADLGDADDGWHEILMENGEIGYMSGDFLSPDPQ